MTTISITTSTNDTGFRTFVKRHPLVSYFSLAYAGMWTLVFPLVLDSLGLVQLPDVVSLLMFILSSFIGPTVAAYIVTGILDGREGVKKLFRRSLQWRVGIQWYAAALFGFLFVFLTAYSLVYNGSPIFNLLGNWQLLFSLFVPKILFGLLIPSIGEESGWRGFALPRLQAQHGPVLGSLILGLLHGLWHLPIFFTPFLGPFTLVGFLAFLVTGISATFIYTWIYNNTRGSLLIAMLVHAAGNASSPLVEELLPKGFALSPQMNVLVDAGWINSLGFLIAAILIVVLTKGNISYKPNQTEQV